MDYVSFTPLGGLHTEAGVIYLLMNFLHEKGASCAQLRCNGAFSLCDIDGSDTRDVSICLYCMGQQRKLALWSDSDEIALTKFITPDLVEDTQRWGALLSDKDLPSVSYNGIKLFSYCSGTFERRFSTSEFDINNKRHPRYLKRLLVSSARMWSAAEKFVSQTPMKYLLVTQSKDFMTQILLKHAEKAQIPVISFAWDTVENVLIIKSPKSPEEFRCELLVDDITRMRSEPSTWSNAVLDVIQDIIEVTRIAE